MAENTIDTLSLEVSSNAASASKGLDRLTASLLGLDKATGRLQTGKFSKIGTELQAFSKATAKLKGLNVPDFSGLANSIGALGKINFNDSGITKTINALKRLGETDLSGFDTNSFSKIAQSIQGLSNIPDVSNNLNRFISSISKLVNAGDKTGAVTNDFPRFGDALKEAVNKISATGDISESVNLFVQSIGRLATAGNKTGQTAAQLNALADSVLQFFNRMQSAPDISDKTIRMTEALGQLASVGGKVGTATESASKAFTTLGNSSKKSADTIIKAMDKAVSSITKAIQKMASLLGKGAMTIAKGAKSIVSSFTLIGRSNKGINSTTTSLKNLLRAVLPILGIRQLINWGRDAVETASSLTEVQNIVDVTFGDMKNKVEELAETSIGDFGMSELTLKQISSRFQSMGTAMGFTQDKMSDMSIELTKLAADMASFYNVEQADVAEDLAAIFTGQTRPLRQYGLDLTQATLEEWALKNGMDANIQSMSQAEKTLLRYQYVLANTTAAQGDFARTAGTWANQTRILAQTFQALGAIIGRVSINALKPFVSSLNSVMQKVISFAKTVADALGTIFGWTFEVSGGGVLDDVDDIEGDLSGAEDASDGVAGGLGDAADNADKLKKKLSVLPFDQLNQLAADLDKTGKSGSGAGGSGNGAGTGAGAGAGGLSTSIVPTDSILKKYESDIKSLEQLGEYIGDALIKAMKGIDWDSVYEGARNFGTGLADFLNGLISPELFGETGRLVSNSLNTALYALNSFGETFDWTNFGNSISSGINSFFRNFKADLAADTFDTFANGILDAMVAIFGEDGIEWSRIGAKISVSVRKALNGIKWEKAYEAAGGFGKGLAKFMNKLITPETFAAIGTTLGNTVGSVVRGVHEWVTEADFYTWGVSLGTALNNFFNSISWTEVGLTLDGLIGGLVDFMKGLNTEGQFEEFGAKIGTALSQVQWGSHLSDAAAVIASSLGNLLKGMVSTPAGKFLVAFGAALTGIKIATSIYKFVDGISTILGGDRNTRILKKTMEDLLGGATQSAAETASTTIEEVGTAAETASGKAGILKTLLGGLGEGAVISGIVLIGKKLGELADAANGGNGKLTELGGAVDTFATKLYESSAITGTQKDELFALKEELENSGATTEEFATAFVQKLTECGVSSEQLKQAVDEMGGTMNVTDAQGKFLSQTIDGLGSAAETMAGKYVKAGTDSDAAFSVIEQAIMDTAKETQDYETVNNNLLQTFRDTYAQTGSVDAAYDAVVTQLQNLGDKTEIVDGKTVSLSESLTKNVNSALGDMATNAESAATATENVGTKTNNSVGNLLGFIAQAALMALGLGSIKTGSEEAGKEVGGLDTLISNFVQNLPGYSETTKSEGKAAGENYPLGFAEGIEKQTPEIEKQLNALTSKLIEQPKLDLDMHSPSGVTEGYGQNYDLGFANGISGYIPRVTAEVTAMIKAIKDLFPAEYQNLYSYGTTYMTKLSNGMTSKKSDVSNAVGNITKTIKSKLSIGDELYSKGKSIMQSFAKGMKSVPIPKPYMKFTTSTSKNGDSVTTSTSSTVGWHANGGFFNRPTIIGVGEAGREIALPLDNPRVMRTVSNSIMDNASHQFVDTSAIESVVERAMARAMMRNSNNQPINVYATLKTENDEVLARAVTRGQKKLDYRMNPTPQF